MTKWGVAVIGLLLWLASASVFAGKPLISGSPPITVNAGSAYLFVPTASDPDGDKLTFGIKNKPAWALFDTNTGVLSGVPTIKQVTFYKSISLYVSDGKETVSLPLFTITVVNPPPVISGVPATTVTVGTAYRFAPVATDPNNDVLTFSITGKLVWATFDAKTGVLSGSPTVAQAAVYKGISIQVTDGKTKVSLPTFDLTVIKSLPPIISGVPATTVTVGTAYRFVPIASDPENDPLTFSITNKPIWATFDTKTGELSGIPTSTNVGITSNILIQVSDGKQQVKLAAFSIQVIVPTPVTACHVSYKITKEWNNGFSADVTLTNLGTAWASWKATWDMPNGQTLSDLWGGNATQSGSLITVTNMNWNGAIAKAGTVTFGFNGAYKNTNNMPTNVSVNGVLCSGNAKPPPPPVVACNVTYTLVSEWDTGYTADVHIKNTGEEVSDWTVAWDMPDGQKITGMWNGTLKQTDSHVDVTHAGWNRMVAKGGNLQFGFNGIHQGLNRTPGNISLNGVKCGGQVDPPPPPPPACEVKYQIQKDWGQGFTGTVDIKNTGAPWNGWTTTWTMPTGQIVTGGWNAQITQAADQVTAKHVDSNKIVKQNNSIAFGFNASLSGLNATPIDVAVNGTRCSGQSDTLVLPPRAPTVLTATLVDNNYVTLTWQDNSANESNMLLERRANSGGWSVFATLAADTVTYQDKTLGVGIAYEYRLKAVNASGSSAYTSTVRAKRQDRTDIRAAMLVNNCAACHGTDGYSTGPGTPSIAGMNKTYLVRTMQAYRTGERASSVMNRIAKGYTDTQIERVAEYLSKLPYKAAKQTTDATLVARGKAVHESNCQFCHAGTGNDAGFTKTLLDGQWSTYLHATLEDYHAGRSSNVPPEMANQLKNIKTQFGDDILLALAQYYASDKSTGGGGGGDGGGDSKVVPSVPTGLTVTVVNNSQVNLGWKDNSHNEYRFPGAASCCGY